MSFHSELDIYTHPRKTKLYRDMDNYTAVSIAEGFYGGDVTLKEQQVAWQYIIDKKLYLSLQGWFGRNAVHLIDQGICTLWNI